MEVALESPKTSDTKKFNWKPIKETFKFFWLVNIFGGLMPFWIGVLIGLGYENFTQNSVNFSNFISNGEIYIYSAGIFISIAYSLKEYTKDNDFLSFIFWTSFMFLVVSSVLFSAISTDSILKEGRFDREYLIFTSKILLACSLAYSIIAQYNIEVRKNFDITKNNQDDFEEFRKDFQKNKDKK